MPHLNPFQKQRFAGFTLIEVLVAMTIIAVALVGANRASLLTISHSEDIKQRLLADMVAQNRLALHLAYDDWGSGHFSGVSQQAGIRFIWKEEVTPTPNPALMKVVVTVASANQPEYQLRHLVGFLVNPKYQYAN